MEEKKYPIGGYAPGNYTCKCCICKQEFQGDKRAVQCESCAVKALRELLKPYEQPGAVWVRASERLPVPGFYNAKKNGSPFTLAMTVRDKKMPKEYWENVEWLDESGTAAGREEVETIDIETAKRHAVAFANWLLPPGPICTEKDYELFMMKPESLLTQPRADLIREANNRDLDGVGSDAVEFAEWIRENHILYLVTNCGYMWADYRLPIGQHYLTTAQLYAKFKQQKEK